MTKYIIYGTFEADYEPETELDVDAIRAALLAQLEDESDVRLTIAPAGEDELGAWCDGLVALAEHLRTRPGLFTRMTTRWDPVAQGWADRAEVEPPEPMTLNILRKDATELAEAIRLLGGGEKYSDGGEWSTTGVKRSFGPHVVDVYTYSSEVCRPKRKETRVRQVVELTDEAKAEIEAIRARHTRTETSEVVTEWDCPPSLLNPGTAV